MTATLGQRARRGVLWAVGAQGLIRSLSTVRTLLLARFLSPGEFGLFAVAMLALSALEQMSRFGLNLALIQKQDASDVDVDTAWTVQLVRSTGMALLLFLGAEGIARLFAEPRVIGLLRVVAAAQFISGWKNIGIVLFQKELQFRQKALFDVAGEAAVLAVSLLCVLLLRDAWALVWGYLAGVLVSVTLSYAMHPHRPRWRLDGAAFRSMFYVGKHVYLQTVLIFLFTDGDDWFTGSLLGTAALGVYQMAYRLSNLVATELATVIAGVTFPAYAKMQGNREVLARSFLRVFDVVSFTVIPLGVAMNLLAHDGVLLLLTERWLPVVPTLQVLSVFGVLAALSATFGPMYFALGRADIPTRITMLQVGLMALALYPLSLRYGVVGVAVAVTAAILVGQSVNVLWFARVARLPVLRLLTPPASALLLCGMVAVEVRLLGALMGLYPALLLIRVALTGLAAALLFAAHVWLLMRWVGVDLWTLVFGSEGHGA